MDEERMSEETSELRLVDGRVKWFDPAKGFGFILDEVGGPRNNFV